VNPSLINYTTATSWAAERRRRAECVRLARLVSLVYELLDASADTQRLLLEVPHAQLPVCVHLDYLRDLQRVGRELLAQVGSAVTD